MVELMLAFLSPLFLVVRAFRRKEKTFTSIVITGASRGIGEGLAKGYAKPGVRLVLVARNVANLEKVKNECTALGAEVDVFPGDVTDEKRMTEIIEQADSKAPLDLVIANAGIADSGKDWFTKQNMVCQVNLAGVANVVMPALSKFRERKSGQIAIISSASGYMGGWIEVPMYAATKSAVLAYSRAMRKRQKKYNIGVTCVMPCFIPTDMVSELDTAESVDRWSMYFAGFMKLSQAVPMMQEAIASNVQETCFKVRTGLLCRIVNRYFWGIMALFD